MTFIIEFQNTGQISVTSFNAHGVWLASSEFMDIFGKLCFVNAVYLAKLGLVDLRQMDANFSTWVGGLVCRAGTIVVKYTVCGKKTAIE